MVNQKAVYLPCQINPLIKFTRWTLLVAGVIYGFMKHKKFHAIETARREEEERLRPMREAQLAREKKITAERELRMLEEIFLGSSSVETNPIESKETNQENPVNEQ